MPRATSHVEDKLTFEIVREDAVYHLSRGLVMPSAERHLWIDADVVVPLWHIFVEGGSDDTARVLSNITMMSG